MSTKPVQVSDVVVAEWNTSHSRDVVAIDDGETIVVGDIIGNDSGSVVVWATGMTVVGVALESSASTSTTSLVTLVRGPAIVNGNNLNEDDADAIAGLVALGIVVRS